MTDHLLDAFVVQQQDQLITAKKMAKAMSTGRRWRCWFGFHRVVIRGYVRNLGIVEHCNCEAMRLGGHGWFMP